MAANSVHPAAGRRHARKTCAHMALVWNKAKLEPVTCSQAAARLGLGLAGARKILLAMLAGGHLQTLPREHTGAPQRFFATAVEPPPARTHSQPSAVTRTDRDRMFTAERIAEANKQFEFYPAWLIRIQQSPDVPGTASASFVKRAEAKRWGDLRSKTRIRRHRLKG